MVQWAHELNNIMKEELTFSEAFVSILSAVLFCVCVIGFDARGHGFFRTIGQSAGISILFFLVAYNGMCDDYESRATTDPPELDDHAKFLEKTDDELFIERAMSFGFDKEIAEKYYDDQNDPWVQEFEKKYGKLPKKEKNVN